MPSSHGCGSESLFKGFSSTRRDRFRHHIEFTRNHSFSWAAVFVTLTALWLFLFAHRQLRNRLNAAHLPLSQTRPKRAIFRAIKVSGGFGLTNLRPVIHPCSRLLSG
jgi:hypothetical protein